MERLYTITSDGEITAITVRGVVTESLLKQVTEELWQGNNYHHPCLLWDFRDSIAGVGPQEIKAMSAFAAGNKGERGYGRIALVVGCDMHLKLSRIYENYTRSFPFEVKTFSDIDTARSWLHDTE